uniref:MORN repeat containing 2 n=1 Tax=Sinocyclocheilus rhinocerous TaxID=307959 RepID=A0A673KXW8_9TELE
ARVHREADQKITTLKISYIFPNGDKYEGECCRTSDASGVTYTAEWDNDKELLHTLQGAFYSDLFRDNMHHGKGTYRFPDGTEYTGTFNNNSENVFTVDQQLSWTSTALQFL